MARLGAEKGTVEDRRGKTATSRSIFRGKARSLIKATREAVQEAQDANFRRKLEPIVKKAKELSRPRSPQEATDAAMRETSKRKAELDDLNFGNRPWKLATTKKELSDAYRKAVAGKSLLRERKAAEGQSVLGKWLNSMPYKGKKK